jgi:hypothetical protein
MPKAFVTATIRLASLETLLHGVAHQPVSPAW